MRKHYDFSKGKPNPFRGRDTGRRCRRRRSSTLVFRDAGSHTLTSQDPDAPEEQEGGVYALTGGLIESLNTNPPDYSLGVLGWLLSGNMLTIQRDTGDDEFDFNGDGVVTPAAIVLVMQRG